MAQVIDRVELSGIVLVRDAILKLDKPFRLESGEPSFDVPPHIKEAMLRALAENKTHYVASAGIPQLRQAVVDKCRTENGLPVEGVADTIITNGGMHGLYCVFQSLLEPGDEVLIPDPTWTCVQHLITLCGGVVKRAPLHEARGWTFDPDELRQAITPRTRVLMINSPHNPTGGVLSLADLQAIAEIVEDHPHLTVISDEAYEHITYDGVGHVSFASLPGMYPSTISLFTFSKSYAMTGLRLGYVVSPDKHLMERMQKVVLYTINGVNSITQWGGVAALTGPQDCVAAFREEYQARRDLFYEGLRDLPVFEGSPPKGAFYAFLRVADGWVAPDGRTGSWAMTEYLLQVKVGSSPGIIFGPSGDRYLRFSTACDRDDLTGALEAMHALFGEVALPV
ncbi:MAG: pyridoxal phosphate-dependent aminotransferase [Actinomycetota bacterium]|nr:pyridoxal phosphate-dependent aminotransferase [Actinomycetota bacterium]